MTASVLTVTEIFKEMHNSTHASESMALLDMNPWIRMFVCHTRLLNKNLTLCEHFESGYFVEDMINKFAQQINTEVLNNPILHAKHNANLENYNKKVLTNHLCRTSFKRVPIVMYFIEQHLTTFDVYSKYVVDTINRTITTHLLCSKKLLAQTQAEHELFMCQTTRPTPVLDSEIHAAHAAYCEVFDQCYHPAAYPPGITEDDMDIACFSPTERENVDESLKALLVQKEAERDALYAKRHELFAYDKKCEKFASDIEKMQKNVAQLLKAYD
jgi:hypothetical protein